MPNYWFDHVHIISRDPMKTAAFYQNMFGAKITGSRETSDGRIFVDLDLKGSPIKVANLRAQPLMTGVPPTGLEHLGLATDNLEIAVEELKAKGARLVQGIRMGHTPGLKRAFLLAPENVLIELQQTN